MERKKSRDRHLTRAVDEYVDQACDMLADHCSGLVFGCCIPAAVADDMAIQYWERIAEFAAATARELRDEHEQQD